MYWSKTDNLNFITKQEQTTSETVYLQFK